jgi:hypothetical protein
MDKMVIARKNGKVIFFSLPMSEKEAQNFIKYWLVKDTEIVSREEGERLKKISCTKETKGV